MPRYMHGGQTTTSRSWFIPSSLFEAGFLLFLLRCSHEASWPSRWLSTLLESQTPLQINLGEELEPSPLSKATLFINIWMNKFFKTLILAKLNIFTFLDAVFLLLCLFYGKCYHILKTIMIWNLITLKYKRLKIWTFKSWILTSSWTSVLKMECTPIMKGVGELKTSSSWAGRMGI